MQTKLSEKQELIKALILAQNELQWLDKNAIIKSRAGGDYIEIENLAYVNNVITKHNNGKDTQKFLLTALSELLALAEKQLDQSATHDGLTNANAIAKARKAIRESTQ